MSWSKCRYYSFPISFSFLNAIKYGVANFISLLSCSDCFPCSHLHKSNWIEVAMKQSTENVFHIIDVPNSKSPLNHHDLSCLWTVRVHLMSRSIFPLSFLLLLSCLWNTCSNQNAQASFSLPQWSEHFFVVDTFSFEGVPLPKAPCHIWEWEF